VDKNKNRPGLVQQINRNDDAYPTILLERFGEKAPERLTIIGPVEFLGNQKTALFCSARTPGTAILRAYDMARHLRDEGTTVISGFHSPLEKECLKILLRGKQPIIICPARAIERMRIPTECRSAFDSGRILFLSPFIEKPNRIDRESSIYRNEVVAALADRAYLAHVQPEGETERIFGLLQEWKVERVK
jgi:predicted Rossmann fold nucleotide-binding protein DprA/Smf involved in DNA uptake